MAICENKKIVNKFIIILVAIILAGPLHADITFNNLKNKKVSYLDFFLLKFENKLFSRASILSRQLFATRVQYSNVGTEVNLDEDEDKIFIKIYAIMDRARYSKKKYQQKLSDCNQVRNLIFYRKHGYSFLRQKRNPSLSENLMNDIFKEVFFDNINFNKNEVEFLLNKMFVSVTILNPINKTELSCTGAVNDYELK